MLRSSLSRVARSSLASTSPTSVLVGSNMSSVGGVRFASSVSDDMVERGYFGPRGNWGINFLGAGHEFVVERGGKYHGVYKPGITPLVPFLDKIKYCVDTRELCIDIDPAEATTADNVKVHIAGRLYIQFNDAFKAAYGAERPLYSSAQFAQSIARTAVGKFDLDKLFGERRQLSEIVRKRMMGEPMVGDTAEHGTGTESVKEWGAKVIRFEVTDLQPDSDRVVNSLDNQSVAERERRELVIGAEASKREAELKADAYRYQQVTEATGDAEQVRLNADARAYEVEKKAAADAERIRIIAKAIDEAGQEAANFMLAQGYITEFGQLAGNSNTMVVPGDVTDLAKIIGVGSSAMDKLRMP